MAQYATQGYACNSNTYMDKHVTFPHDRTIYDDLLPWWSVCTVQCTLNATGNPGTSFMQPLHYREVFCF